MTAARERLAAESARHGVLIGVDQRVTFCTCGWRNEADDNLTRPLRNWSLHVADALLPVVEQIAAERAAKELRATAERVRGVIDRCNEAGAKARTRGRTLEALAYDDAVEWLRRALDGQP